MEWEAGLNICLSGSGSQRCCFLSVPGLELFLGLESNTCRMDHIFHGHLCHIYQGLRSHSFDSLLLSVGSSRYCIHPPLQSILLNWLCYVYFSFDLLCLNFLLGFLTNHFVLNSDFILAKCYQKSSLDLELVLLPISHHHSLGYWRLFHYHICSIKFL